MIRNAATRELEVLFAAGLISRLERCRPEEIHEKAVNCFDILLDALENEEAAGRVALLINRDTESIRRSAQNIIESMLFNAQNDPQITLCLPKDARKEEARRRWKRLIAHYHPDKYSGRDGYLEKAKKINEAYRAFQISKKRLKYVRLPVKPQWSGVHNPDRVIYFKYLDKVPYYILGFAVCIAAISFMILAR